MKRSIFLFIIVAFVQSAFAQQVDRDEFSDILDRTINFQNYTGTYTQIDSLEQIRGIGRGLAAGVIVNRDSRGSYSDKYQVYHVVGSPEEPGKPADILVFSSSASIDHIDNVRRVIAAYLIAAYKYSESDANLLALFITIYNAVHRGNFELYQSRYKKSVLAFLSADKVGLSLSYRDWPGKSQIVIPLSIAISSLKDENQLTAVTTSDLLTEEVKETVRDRPDDGTAERQRLVELMERTREQEQRALEAERQKVEQERREAQLREAKLREEALEKKDDSVTVVRENENQENQTETEVLTKSEEETRANDREREVQNQTNEVRENDELVKKEEELERREAQNQELEEATNQLREQTAKDLQEAGSQVSAATPLLFVKTTLDNGLVLGKVERVNLGTGQVLAKNDSLQIIGRRLIPFANDHLALVLQAQGDARLVLIADKDLSLQKLGATVISPYSEIVLVPNSQEILAIIFESGEWYLGRFDSKLNPIMRSVIPVDPLGAISLSSGVIVVQRKDGRPTLLQTNDLTSAR